MSIHFFYTTEKEELVYLHIVMIQVDKSGDNVESEFAS